MIHAFTILAFPIFYFLLSSHVQSKIIKSIKFQISVSLQNVPSFTDAVFPSPRTVTAVTSREYVADCLHDVTSDRAARLLGLMWRKEWEITMTSPRSYNGSAVNTSDFWTAPVSGTLHNADVFERGGAVVRTGVWPL